MKQEREILQEKLRFELNKLNKIGKIKELIQSDLLNEYFNKKALTKFLNLNLPLNNLSIDELFHITRLVNNYNKIVEIDEYFTDSEITNAMNNKNNLKLESDPIIEFDNVIYTKSKYGDSWITSITYKELHEYLKTGKLVYNMATQRTGKLRKIGHEMMIVPYINERSVEEIKEQMLKGNFYSNMISFNIVPEFNNSLDYNPEENKLVIDTDLFTISIIDGMHRIMGCSRAIEQNKNLQGELYLKITNMTIEKAQSFIRQEAKGNKQNLDELEKYNPSNKITAVINNINNKGDEQSNILNGRIDMNVNTPDTWITFELFKEGLEWSGFLTDINKTNDDVKLIKMEVFIVDFINTFYKIAKKNNLTVDNSNILTDATFIMGLLITCHKYYKTKEINVEAMEKFVKKLKTTTTKYTYDYPIKPREKKLMVNKYLRLLEA